MKGWARQAHPSGYSHRQGYGTRVYDSPAIFSPERPQAFHLVLRLLP